MIKVFFLASTRRDIHWSAAIRFRRKAACRSALPLEMGHESGINRSLPLLRRQAALPAIHWRHRAGLLSLPRMPATSANCASPVAEMTTAGSWGVSRICTHASAADLSMNDPMPIRQRRVPAERGGCPWQNRSAHRGRWGCRPVVRQGPGGGVVGSSRPRAEQSNQWLDPLGVGARRCWRRRGPWPGPCRAAGQAAEQGVNGGGEWAAARATSWLAASSLSAAVVLESANTAESRGTGSVGSGPLAGAPRADPAQCFLAASIDADSATAAKPIRIRIRHPRFTFNLQMLADQPPLPIHTCRQPRSYPNLMPI